MSKFRSQKIFVVCRSLGVALHIFIDRVSNVKNQPPSFGKLAFIPCRTHWYLYKRTLKVQILQLVWQECSQGQRLTFNFDQIFSSFICASNLVA